MLLSQHPASLASDPTAVSYWVLPFSSSSSSFSLLLLFFPSLPPLHTQLAGRGSPWISLFFGAVGSWPLAGAWSGTVTALGATGHWFGTQGCPALCAGMGQRYRSVKADYSVSEGTGMNESPKSGAKPRAAIPHPPRAGSGASPGSRLLPRSAIPEQNQLLQKDLNEGPRN